MPEKETKHMRVLQHKISRLFIKDYEKFTQGLYNIFWLGGQYRWGFWEDEAEVTIVAYAPGPDDLLKELQDLGCIEKQKMEGITGSMTEHYKKRQQAGNQQTVEELLRDRPFRLEN